jgi:hypothetical protein
VRNTNNRRHTFGVCIKLPVTEHATDESSSFVLLYVEVHQTITCMTQMLFIEPLIERKEGYPTTLQ